MNDLFEHIAFLLGSATAASAGLWILRSSVRSYIHSHIRHFPLVRVAIGFLLLCLPSCAVYLVPVQFENALMSGLGAAVIINLMLVSLEIGHNRREQKK